KQNVAMMERAMKMLNPFVADTGATGGKSEEQARADKLDELKQKIDALQRQLDEMGKQKPEASERKPEE
ncbi:MAG TPA: hypothetical protein VJ487_12735, partial [Alphaproteobacteria bacterium]|nr:hypothetical protein [Alphaproteobacteria bacterium]